MSPRALLQRVYRSLPVLREICQLRSLLMQLKTEQAALRPLQAVAMEDALRQHPRYGDPLRLHAAAWRAFSQNGEDGMIAEIFRRIGAPNHTFVEIGVGDGTENNTRLLLLTGWTGWWCEGDVSACSAIRSRFASELAAGKLQLHEGMLDQKNVQSALLRIGAPTEPDLLSIDVDQLTYHLWEALSQWRPRVVVVEYNATFRPPLDWVTSLDAPMWDGSCLFGASLSAFERLGRERGYSLVGCDLTGINAFFVRSDLVGDRFKPEYDAATHYEPPRYGALGHGARAFDPSLKPRLTSLA